MKRLQVALLYAEPPNFDANAFKYFILSLNKVQTTYEFFFPRLSDDGDAEYYPFAKKASVSEKDIEAIQKFFVKKKIQSDYDIAIITSPFHDYTFSDTDADAAVLTTDGWINIFLLPRSSNI